MGKKGDLRDLVVSVRQAGRNISETVMVVWKNSKQPCLGFKQKNKKQFVSGVREEWPACFEPKWRQQ